MLAPARGLDNVINEATKRANRLHGAALLSAAVNGAKHFKHHKDHKPATAATLTRALKSDDAPAMRYALDKSVTGALHKLKMRVKRSKHTGPGPGSSGPRAAHDVIAARMCDARSRAIRDIESAVLGFDREPNANVRQSYVKRIRSMLHTWAADPAVIQAARLSGWRC